MAGRIWRGLARRLHRYHLDPLHRLTANDARDLAEAELRWLHEEAQILASAKSASPDVLPGRDSASSNRTVWRTLIPMVRRRIVLHEPIAYILGTQPFGSLDIAVRPPVLIPRPETEAWALDLAERLSASLSDAKPKCEVPFKVLDLCTGSGCIGLTLATAVRRHPVAVTCADIANQCVALVKENVHRNAHQLPLDSIHAVKTDLFSDDDIHRLRVHATPGAQGLGAGPFQLIVCNPPYIPPSDFATLEPSVRNWEDKGALIGQRRVTSDAVIDQTARAETAEDGLTFYRRLEKILPALLAPNTGPTGTSTPRSQTSRLPGVVVEVGAGQAPDVLEILMRTRGSAAENDESDGSSKMFSHAELWADAWGIERAVALFRKQPAAGQPSAEII